MSTTTAGSSDDELARSARTAEVVRLLKLEERREPAVAQVATWVGLGIVEGRLTPGQDLNSVDLAKRFQSSRTPVREALMLLESEGLVEMRARKRPRVASFTPERVQEIYFVRQHLLALIGGLAAENVTDPEIADLRTRLDRMSELAAAGDTDAYFWGHVDLQSRLLGIAGNEVLAGILDSLALRTLVLRRASLARPGRLETSLSYQTQILDALEARDGELTGMLLARMASTAHAAIDLALLDGAE